MIVWINGAFGAGKTQAAYELQRRLQNAYVYDPENVGFFLRKNLPAGLCTEDFQDYPMWRTFNLEMLDYIARGFDGTVIVPMTITNPQYYEEIIEKLSQNHPVKHIILCARRETLLKRLASRLEGSRSWAAQQIDRCIQAFDTDITEQKLDTDDLSVEQVAAQIAAISGLPLPKDSRSRARARFERFVTKCRHIRG